MKKHYFFIFLFLISISLVIAPPPSQETTLISTGLQLESPITSIHLANTSYDFHLHVYNASNGSLLGNLTTSCVLHLYNGGEHGHILQASMLLDSNGLDFHYPAPSYLFNMTGQYSIVYYCNTTSYVGGFAKFDFYVTKTGDLLETPEAISYGMLAFLILLMVIVSGWFTLALPYSNKRDETEDKIIINGLKYFKLGMILITHALIVWLLNVLVALSDNYLTLTMYYGFVSFMFNLLNALAWPLFIIVIILVGVNIFRDLGIYKFNKIHYK